MFLSVVLAAGAHTPPASVPPRPSDAKALERGEVVKRVEPVAGAPVPRMRAYILIDTPAEKVYALINRCGDYSTFMPRTVKSVERSRTGKTVVCELHIKLPFFLGHLKTVTRGTHTVGPPAWGRVWRLVSGTFLRNVGRWRFTPWKGDPKVTLVEYAIHAVPDLKLPDMILRKANGRSVPGMLRILRKKLTGSETR